MRERHSSGSRWFCFSINRSANIDDTPREENSWIGKMGKGTMRLLTQLSGSQMDEAGVTLFLFLPLLSELALPGAAVPYVTFRSGTSNYFVYLFSVRESFLYPYRPGAWLSPFLLVKPNSKHGLNTIGDKCIKEFLSRAGTLIYFHTPLLGHNTRGLLCFQRSGTWSFDRERGGTYLIVESIDHQVRCLGSSRYNTLGANSQVVRPYFQSCNSLRLIYPYHL